MECPSCRQALSENALFCSRCGVPTTRVNTATNNLTPPGTDPNKARQDPLAGRVLDFKYKLIERLGEGGMGAVYRALRLHIGDEVAVKLLHRDLMLEEHAIERFRREARSAAMIRHQNVVSIHDFSDASGSNSDAYIVMELVNGASLRSLLKREGRMSPERAVALMGDICAGVGAAHRQGLLHRDLKPDNVIVTPPAHEGERETAKVVDFGLAKLRDVAGARLTQTGAVMGTLYYMSPEQCSSEELDARADVYSLGAMLYEMLAGAPPFQANNLAALIAKHLNEPPPPFPASLQIPTALANACFRALAKNRAQRQEDASALRRELQAALATPADYQVSAPSPPAQHTDSREPMIALQSKSASRRWKWAIGGVSLFLITGVLLVGLGVAIKYGASLIRTPVTNHNTARQTNQETPPREKSDATQSNSESQTEVSATSTSPGDLRGTWTGTYGHFSKPAKLIIKDQKGDTFAGVLEQGETRVAFSGTYSSASRKLTMKQSTILNDPDQTWSLGEDVGSLSGDGKKMSGTGQDAVSGQLGLTYQWSFSRGGTATE